MNTKTVIEDERTKPAAKSKVKPLPDGMSAVTPHLICAGAADAIEFYKKAFDAVEDVRLSGPDGKLIHASIRLGLAWTKVTQWLASCHPPLRQ